MVTHLACMMLVSQADRHRSSLELLEHALVAGAARKVLLKSPNQRLRASTMRENKVHFLKAANPKEACQIKHVWGSSNLV